MRAFGKIPGLILLLLLGAGVARAHDALQASTNIWLYPDRMEVELVMARVPSRSLADNPPSVPISEDNFASVYRPLLLKNVAALLVFNVDGVDLKPRAVDVVLSEETDIEFKLTFDRPAKGVLQISAPFIKKMDDGYMNTIAINEGKNVLGFGDQGADQPIFKFIFGSAAIPLSPSTTSPPPPTPEAVATPPTSAASPAPASDNEDNTPLIKIVVFFLLAALLFAVLVFIVCRVLKMRR